MSSPTTQTTQVPYTTDPTASDYALDDMARSTGNTTLRISGDPEMVPLVSAWLREQSHQAWLMDHEDGYA